MPKVNLAQNTWAKRKKAMNQTAYELIKAKKAVKKVNNSHLASVCQVSRQTLERQMTDLGTLRVASLIEIGKTLNFTADDYNMIFSIVAAERKENVI